MTSGLVVTSSSGVRVASYPPGATFGPRRLRDHEFVWVLHGSAVWEVQDPPSESIRLTPGRLALSYPGTVDSFRWDPQQETVHAYVHFSLAAAGAPAPQPASPALRPGPRIRAMSQPAVLGGLCRHLVDLAGEPAVDPDRTARLLAVLLEEFVAGPVADPADALPPAVAAVVEEARRHWRDGLRAIPVPVLAAGAHISPGHLFRVFREAYGCSPARALEAVRLARAATLLQRSNATLAEIAHRCGFANAYHFSRRFAAAFGQPPGAYRTAEDRDPYEQVRIAGLLPVAYALLEG